MRCFQHDKNEGKIVEMECVRSFQQNKLYAKQNPYNPFDPRAKKTYMTYMFKIITEVVGVSPEASGDKNEGKIVEVEYEIPPKSE